MEGSHDLYPGIEPATNALTSTLDIFDAAAQDRQLGAECADRSATSTISYPDRPELLKPEFSPYDTEAIAALISLIDLADIEIR